MGLWSYTIRYFQCLLIVLLMLMFPESAEKMYYSITGQKSPLNAKSDEIIEPFNENNELMVTEYAD